MNISKEYPRLLVTAESFPDESLRGYLLRLCELNGYRRLRWLTKFAGYRGYNTPPDNRAFRILSRLSGIPEGRLHAFAYNEVQKSGAGTHLIRYSRFGTTLIKSCLLEHTHARICPHCLAEASYMRAIWDIKFVTACARHGAAFLERCPRCSQRLTWKRSSVSFCTCGFDLRQAQTVPIMGPELELNKLMHSASGQFDPVSQSEYGLPVADLALLNLSEILDLLTFIGRVNASGSEKKKFLPSKLPLQDAVALTRHSTVCFSDWPTHFHVLLRNSIGHQKKTEIFRVRQRLKKLYPRATALVRQPRYEFVRHAIRNFLGEESGGHRIRRSVFVPDLDHGTTQFLSANQVSNTLRCDNSTVRHLLERGFLRRAISERVSRSAIFITRKSVESLSNFLASSVGVVEAARMLGVTERTVFFLEKGRLIIARPHPIRRRRSLFMRDDIKKLLVTLDNKVVPRVKQYRGQHSIPFRAALRRTGVPIAGFVQRMQRGLIVPIAVDSAQTGLQKYLYDLNDLKALKKNRRLL